jgi:NADPH-dependent 2,4-dienoyl-CoA reductase/sulfur reductase-like enzyme
MTERADVAVVGAGPAGLAAAVAAALAGKRVVLLDEGFRPGGQIWRHRSGQVPSDAQRLLSMLEASSVKVLSQASVFDLEDRNGRWRLALSLGGHRVQVEAGAIILACGARERFLPFPGWTLPGVTGAGGGQALIKEGLTLQGESVLVAGTGPLLLPVAASVRKAGGRLLGVLEQAPWRRVLGMAPPLAVRPAKAAQAMRLGWDLFGVPYRPGWWVTEALGTERLEAVRMTNGHRTEEVTCRWLFCGFGLVPNVELGRALGCEGTPDGLYVDGAQRTSVEGIFAAGEVCGVSGVDAALAEGTIAGLFAAEAWNPASSEGRRLLKVRAQARRMGTHMEALFALRPELRSLPRPDTIVCRCEDVPFGAIDPAWDARETKLCTRAGMGPCQGRVCGPSLIYQFGHRPDSVRLPLKSTAVGHLIPEDA